MSTLAKAISIASVAFENKTDKAGEPYILHCLRVMNNLHTRDKELQIIAVLHDLVEDCDNWSFERLQKEGFSIRVIKGIMDLTYEGEGVYHDYIKHIGHNRDATKVKLADLKDNSDITRLKGLRKKDFDRMEKYHAAYTYLSSI